MRERSGADRRAGALPIHLPHHAPPRHISLALHDHIHQLLEQGADVSTRQFSASGTLLHQQRQLLERKLRGGRMRSDASSNCFARLTWC